MILSVIFWCLSLIVLYTFIGYPIILKFFQKLKIDKKTPYEPTVTLLIVAHNEENQIVDKLRNTQQLNYPKKLLQVMVVSDGSHDVKTNGIWLQHGWLGDDKWFQRHKKKPHRSGACCSVSGLSG